MISTLAHQTRTELLGSWLSHLGAVRGLATGTLERYRRCVEAALTHLDADPRQLGFDDLERHLYSVLIRRAKASGEDRRMPIADPTVSRMLGAYIELRPKIASSPWLFPSSQRQTSLHLASLDQWRPRGASVASSPALTATSPCPEPATFAGYDGNESMS